MLPVTPVTPSMMVLLVEASLKLRLSVPAPVNVFPMVTVEPVALVLFISSVAPLAMLAAPVPMESCVVLTVAMMLPALTVVPPV